MKGLIFSLIVIGMVLGFAGFLDGSLDGSTRGCKYDSIASYFPTYVVGCELFKKRF